MIEVLTASSLCGHMEGGPYFRIQGKFCFSDASSFQGMTKIDSDNKGTDNIRVLTYSLGQY